MSENKKNNSKKLIIIVIVLLILFMLLMGGALYYFVFLRNAEPEKPVTGGQREAAAIQGSLKVLSEEELEAELAKTIEEGMFRISIASRIVATEDGRADVRIENNQTNRYLMQVSIYLDETGEEIYATDLIDPGYYIQSTQFDKPLKAGDYDATAVFTALYTDTEEIVGTAGANVEIIVLPAGTTPTPSPTPEPTATPEAGE